MILTRSDKPFYKRLASYCIESAQKVLSQLEEGTASALTQKPGRKYYLAIAFIFLFSSFLKLYRINEIPYGINVDEAGMAYDAWCLANFGTDRYGTVLPIYLTNFGGGQSALYAYMVAGLMKLTGSADVSTLLMRLPAAFVSIFAFPFGVYILRRLFGCRNSVIFSLLMSVMPYFVMQCRFGLDCNLCLNVTTIALALLFWATDSRFNFRLYSARWLLCGIAWGITYYTYALCWIPTTCMVLLITAYLLYCKKISFTQIAIWYTPIILLGLPLAAMVLINILSLNSITIGITIPRLPVWRAGDLTETTFSYILGNFWRVFRAILYKDWIIYNSLKKIGVFHIISAPVILVGFFSFLLLTVRRVKSGRFSPYAIILLVFFPILVQGFFIGPDGPNINRLNQIYFVQFVFLVNGLRTIYSGVSVLLPVCKRACIVVLLLAYTASTIFFLREYFILYPTKYYPQFLFSNTFPGVMHYLEEKNLTRNKIHYETEYVYYALTTDLTPAQFASDWNKDITFGPLVLPDEIELSTIYVVRETNTDYITFLLDNGYTQAFHEDMFTVFVPGES